MCSVLCVCAGGRGGEWYVCEGGGGEREWGEVLCVCVVVKSCRLVVLVTVTYCNKVTPLDQLPQIPILWRRRKRRTKRRGGGGGGGEGGEGGGGRGGGGGGGRGGREEKEEEEGHKEEGRRK